MVTFEMKDVEVWLVDGEEVRNRYKADFIEGGIRAVYSWCPNHEIWLESGEHREEMPYILLHEYVEMIAMRYKNKSYDKAHAIAAKWVSQPEKGGLRRRFAFDE